MSTTTYRQNIARNVAMEVNVRDKKIAQKHNMLTDVFRYRKYCISL